MGVDTGIEMDLPVAEAPDDPTDGTDDDDPALEAIDEDDGTPEDGVPSLIRDEEAQPISGPF